MWHAHTGQRLRSFRAGERMALPALATTVVSLITSPLGRRMLIDQSAFDRVVRLLVDLDPLGDGETAHPWATPDELTPELLRSGKWKTVEIRPYDVRTFAPTIHPGKVHILTEYIEVLRRPKFGLDEETLERWAGLLAMRTVNVGAPPSAPDFPAGEPRGFADHR